MSPRRLGLRATSPARLGFATATCAAALAVHADPAAAWVERYSFDDIPAFASPSTESNNIYSDRGLVMDQGCGYYRIGAYGPSPFGPRTGGQALVAGGINPCSSPSHYFGWNNAPRTAQLWVRSASTPRSIVATDYTNPGSPVATTYTLSAGSWTRIQVVKAAGASVTLLELRSPTSGEFVVDDIAVSDQAPTAPPATVIDSQPPASGTNTSATVAFHNTDPDPTFTCQLDDAAATACTSPWSRTGLAVGTHTLRVRATGIFGAQEATAKVVTWTVTAPPPPPPPAPPATTPPATSPPPVKTTQAKTTPAKPPMIDPYANCQPGPDSDRDGIPDSCDTVGAPGTVPPEPGERTTVQVVAGEVFIKLPPGAAGARAGVEATRQQAAPDPGTDFIPLKGNASIPVGSTVDARAGSINLTSATGASAKGGNEAPTASAKLSAAIFQIRQDRAKRHSGKAKKKLAPNPTALVLRSPEGAIAAARCRENRGSVIRALSAVVPKGTFQFVGATATVDTATAIANIRTVDRCDGTFTEVGRGVATVTSLHRKHRKVVRVKAGRAYLMKGDFVGIEGAKGR